MGHRRSILGSTAQVQKFKTTVSWGREKLFLFARSPLLALLDEAVLRARRRVFRPQQARAGRRRGRGRRWRGRGRARCPNAPAEELHDVELQLVSRPDAQRARQEIVPALRRGPRPGYHCAAGDVAACCGTRSVRCATPCREKSRHPDARPSGLGRVSPSKGADLAHPRRRGHPDVFYFARTRRLFLPFATPFETRKTDPKHLPSAPSSAVASCATTRSSTARTRR